MADDKPKDTRQRPSKGEEFEVKHLTETTDLSPKQARDLLRKHGNDWRKIEGRMRRTTRLKGSRQKRFS